MEKLPKYTRELIEELDLAIPYVQFPCHLEGVEELSEKKLRRLAFMVGQRALIDDLLTLLNEDQDGDRDNNSGGDIPDRDSRLGDGTGSSPEED
tara:strand:+ start:639 stop:920 length:282 start_codon:yes stop_codon:yes gene_type:complete